jgi:mono/diheme cytochrome c family protein
MTQRLLLALMICLLAGCRQQMAQQPAYRPLQSSNFFPDGRGSRPVVEGTVPRGELPVGPYYTGRKATNPAQVAALVAAPNPLGAAVQAADGVGGYVDELPFAPDQLGRMMRRGQERFNIFCAPCHDRVGTGRGMIVERGFTAPPSLHTDKSRGFAHKQQDLRLRDAPVGYYFEVITQGYGAMPSYRVQIPPEDRWAIVAYVRALQVSQGIKLADVPDMGLRQKLEESRGRKQ